MISDRLNRINHVVSNFRIELYCFLFFLATHMINLPLKQLIFDKLCLNNYRLAVDSCESIGDGHSSESKVYNQIQSTFTTLTLYQHSLSIPPSILLTFILAHWIDTRLDHLRYILALPCIGGAILNIFLTVQCINFNAEPIDTIYPFIVTGLSGGEVLAVTGAFTFICKSTESKHRPIRFVILQAASSLAFPLAYFLSDKLLSQTPWIYGQYRNYIGVFLVSGSILTFTEFWILITLWTGRPNSSNSQSRRQSRKVSQVSAYSYYKSLQNVNARRATAFSLQIPGPSNRRESSLSHGRRTSVATLLMGFSMMNKLQPGQRFSLEALTEDGLDTRRTSAISNSNAKHSSSSSSDFTFSQVIHYTNLIMTCKAFLRSRVNYGRLQLICLTISMTSVFLTFNSVTLLDKSSTVRIFNWARSHAEYINDIKAIGTNIGSILIMIVLVILLKFQEVTIVVIGLSSMLIALLIKAFLPIPIGFYLSSIIEILFGLTLSSFRSLVTSFVYNYEIAKIFAIIASLMTLTHPIVILIFIKLLDSMRQSKPRLLYLLLGLLLIIPVTTVILNCFLQRRSVNNQKQRKSFCTIQVTPSPLPGPSKDAFEVSLPSENSRRKSNRF